MASSRVWVTPFVIGIIVGSVGGIAVGAAVAPPILGQGRRLLSRFFLESGPRAPVRFDLLVQ